MGRWDPPRGASTLESADLRIAGRAHKVAVQCSREHREHWVVVQRHGNASAFNGYRWQESDYSLVECRAPGCSRSPWRTKAAYAESLPDVGHHPPLPGGQK